MCKTFCRRKLDAIITRAGIIMKTVNFIQFLRDCFDRAQGFDWCRDVTCLLTWTFIREKQISYTVREPLVHGIQIRTRLGLGQ